MVKLRVLVVSSWPEVSRYVITLLRTAGHQASAYVSGQHIADPPDVVVREANGVNDHPLADCPTVLMSGSWTADWLTAARELGAVVLSKPFTAPQLLDAISQAAQIG